MSYLIMSEQEPLENLNDGTNPSIAIDIDDTLTSFNDLAKKVIWKRFRETGDKVYKGYVYASLSQWRTPLDILTKDEWISIVNECHSPENIAQNIPFAGSVEIINELAKNNEIYYVSNRAPRTYKDTVAWLRNSGYPNPETVICLADKPKIDFFLIQDIDYIIDDRPKTLVEFSYFKNNAKSFGLLTEYNTSLTDLDNIYLAHDWYGLAYFLEKENIF